MRNGLKNGDDFVGSFDREEVYGLGNNLRTILVRHSNNGGEVNINAAKRSSKTMAKTLANLSRVAPKEEEPEQ